MSQKTPTAIIKIKVHIEATWLPPRQTQKLHIRAVAADLWSGGHLPAGAAHVKVGFARQAARKLGVKWAAAMTGFELRKRRSFPKLEGVVVAQWVEKEVRRTAAELEKKAEERGMVAANEECLQRWSRVLRAVKAARVVAKKYGRVAAGAVAKNKFTKNKFKKDDEAKETEKKKQEEESDCKIVGHDFEERQVDGDLWEKVCVRCGIRMTFEKI